MKKTILTALLTTLFLSCGSDSDRVNNNNVGSSAIAQRVQTLERSLPCISGSGATTRRSVGFIADLSNRNSFPELRFKRLVRSVSLSNLNNVMGTYVGTTQFNDIVVVKEINSTTAEVLIRMCEAEAFVSQITSFEVFRYSTSNVTGCNFNQITALNMTVTSRTHGTDPQPIITTSACEQEFQQSGF